MATDEAPNLSALIGANIRRLREEMGMSADDFAAVARSVLLDWTRATVTAVELGRREISLDDELVPLMLALTVATEGEIGLVDLLQSLGNDTDRVIVGLRYWEIGTVRLLFDGHRMRRAGERQLAIRAPSGRMRRKVLPGPPSEAARQLERARRIHEADTDARRDAERKAAARLGVGVDRLLAAARELWGRGLTEERDRRLRESRQENDNLRRLQARRGHITRALISELADALERGGRG